MNAHEPQSSVSLQSREAVAAPLWKQPLDMLLADPLLCAMNAGWTTEHDAGFLGPVLQDVHRELVRAGIQSLHADRSRPFCSTLHLDEDVEKRSLTVLKYMGQSSDPVVRPRLPSCARFFINSAADLYADSSTECRQAFIKMTLEISALGFAAMERSLANVAVDVAMKLAVLRQGAMARGSVLESDAVDAVDGFLQLQIDLLSDLFDLMRLQRLTAPIERIQSRRSLEIAEEPPIALFPGVGEIMFEEKDEKRSIEFTVERYPCTAEVLDPRVVRIPPGKYNNRHKHAHETLFLFLSGTGEILVGEQWVKVKSGDAVFSPRWAIHQTHNTGPQELVLLAVTDYYLTSQVYVGKYDKI